VKVVEAEQGKGLNLDEQVKEFQAQLHQEIAALETLEQNPIKLYSLDDKSNYGTIESRDSEYFSSSTLQIDNDATNSELADDDFQFEEKFQVDKIRKRQTDSNFPPPPNDMSYDNSFNISDYQSQEEPARSHPENASRNLGRETVSVDHRRESDDLQQFGFSTTKPNFDPSMTPSKITHDYTETKPEPDIFPKRANPDDRPVIYIDDSIPKTMTGPIDRSFDEPKRSYPAYKAPISFDSTPISPAKKSWKDRTETKSIETDSVKSGPEIGGTFRGKETNSQNDADDGASIYSYISDRTETSNRLPRLENPDRDDFQRQTEIKSEPEVWRGQSDSKLSTGCIAEPQLPTRLETTSRETDNRSETGSYRDRIPSSERFNRSRFDQQSVDSLPETNTGKRPPSPGPRRTDVPPRYDNQNEPNLCPPSPGARLRDVMSSYDRQQSNNVAPMTKPKILEPVTPRWGERTNVNKILDKFSGKQENTENSYLCRTNEIQSSAKPKIGMSERPKIKLQPTQYGKTNYIAKTNSNITHSSIRRNEKIPVSSLINKFNPSPINYGPSKGEDWMPATLKRVKRPSVKSQIAGLEKLSERPEYGQSRKSNGNFTKERSYFEHN